MALKVAKKAEKKAVKRTELEYRERPVITEVDEYKGNKYFHFYDAERHRKADGDNAMLGAANILSFGVAKAKLIIEAIDEIRAFVEENE